MLLTREIIATSLRVSMPGSVGVSGARDNPVEGPRDGGARDDFGEGPRRADRRAFQWRDRGLHSAGVVVVRGGAERDPAAARPVAGPCSPAETVSPWRRCGGAAVPAAVRASVPSRTPRRPRRAVRRGTAPVATLRPPPSGSSSTSPSLPARRRVRPSPPASPSALAPSRSSSPRRFRLECTFDHSYCIHNNA